MFLDKRGRGEELVLFNPNDFANITELFAWFAENVMAVVGPHANCNPFFGGELILCGAMMNHRWANKDTFVLDFMPAHRIEMINYEEASLLSQTYAVIIVEPRDMDMEIDIEGVVALVHQHLGVLEEDPLRKS
ncbi:hypothetical protein K438DRAFT_1772152 [Mycena galopus ATCC 62051]|nr:hypothetical protein K438DRAFT_1772152 [Mycena galopus ATCC 62051]